MTKATLHAALTTAIASLMNSGACFDIDEASAPYASGGISYPQDGADSLPCVTSNFPLESFKGKGTRKYGHIQIWRHENGRYEPNAYVL